MGSWAGCAIQRGAWARTTAPAETGAAAKPRESAMTGAVIFCSRPTSGRNLAANQPGSQYALDVGDIRTLGARSEGRSRSARARASSAADAVNEILRNLRKIVIHHVGDAFYVNAARGDVGRHQNAIVAVLEATQRLGALVLAAVAVDGGGLHAVARQFLRPAGPRRAWCGRRPETNPSRRAASFGADPACGPARLRRHADRSYRRAWWWSRPPRARRCGRAFPPGA